MTEVKLLVDADAVDDAEQHRLTDAPAGTKSGTAAQLGELIITGAFSTATVATPGRVITGAPRPGR